MNKQTHFVYGNYFCYKSVQFNLAYPKWNEEGMVFAKYHGINLQIRIYFVTSSNQSEDVMKNVLF